ncbi:double zinc ribbon domain-containing protein [Halopiger aswanensis]|uniref:double zinc ribbon domain-containing protein n=1 Tax=Halopiger aswanensis TaxID=148449 RepID=UPI000E76EAA9|nr:zinc ribbon domain-containing protein [Halopiger aswanensis]
MPPGNSSASGRRPCPDCEATVPVDANFCLHCGAELRKVEPAYCSSCGDAFDRDDEFCSNCGTPRNGVESDATRSSRQSRPHSDSSRQRRARRAFERRIQRHLDAGWELQHDYGDRVVLVDRDIGSIPVHVVLLLTTGGVGNLLYGWYHYSERAEQRHLSIDDQHAPPVNGPGRGRDSPAAASERLSTGSAYVTAAMFLFVGAVLSLVALLNGAIVPGLIGLAFAAVGLYVAPAFRRRFKRRHGSTDFGRKRTVDHRVVGPDEASEADAERCVVCNEPFDGGLVRRRRDETVVAGFPVRTHAMEHNYYCSECARTDLFGPGSDSRLTSGSDVTSDLESDDSGGAAIDEDAGANTETATDAAADMMTDDRE